MQMLDRLKKTVSSTVNSVIGNPVCREYDIGAQVATCGPGSLWKVYDGKKKSTGQEVSVFVFEKKILEKMERKSCDLVLECMRAGPTHLARLRHPRLLVVQHSMEESRDSLAFATEPVFSSLANILGNHKNLSPVPKQLQNFELYDVEKVYGLYQIIEGLIFLHNDAKRLHGNLTTESIVITKNGQWKVCGLHFSKIAVATDVQLTFDCPSWDSQLNPICQPELDYTAPEHVLSRTCNTSSDMFSLGVLIYAIYNNGQPLFDCQADIVTYKKHIEKVTRSLPPLGSIPHEFQDQVKTLLSISPELRSDAHQLSKATYFDNVAAQTLHYLDTLMQRDNMTKSQFFKSLYKIISMLPKRVVIQRVLPHLCLEFSNQAMIPFVLPNVLLIAESCTDQEYNEIIFPKLKPVLKIQDPVQIVLILLKKMDLLLTKTPKDEIQFSVLPMVFQALEATSEQVQELALTIIPSFAKMIEYSVMKHSIIPRIKTLCLKSNSFSVRVNCLVCFGKILEFLDKFLIIDEVFPLLPEIPSREPAICMAILGIYKQTMIHKKLSLDKDYIATKAVPFLLPLAVEPGLNSSQFSQFMSVIRDMVTRVEVEQKAKLEQLKQLQDETKSSLAFAQEVQQSKEMDDLMGKVTNLFSGSSDKAAVKGTPPTEQKSLPNGSAAFNKFFGFNDAPSEQSQGVKDLTSLSREPEKPANQTKISHDDPFGSTGHSSTTKPVTSREILAPKPKPNPNMTSLSRSAAATPVSSSTMDFGSARNVPAVSSTTPYAPSGQPARYNTIGFPQSNYSSYNAATTTTGSSTANPSGFNLSGYSMSRGMTPRPMGPSMPYVTSTMTSSSNTAANSSSLSSLTIPGFTQPQTQSRSLNQMASSQQPLQQPRTGSQRPPAASYGAPLPNNATFDVNSTPLMPNQSSNNKQSTTSNADLLDIFG